MRRLPRCTGLAARNPCRREQGETQVDDLILSPDRFDAVLVPCGFDTGSSLPVGLVSLRPNRTACAVNSGGEPSARLGDRAYAPF